MRNIALFVVDCLRYDDSKILEEALAKSVSNLGSYRLNVFEDCYSSSSWTYPSTNSILTGLYPHAHGAKQSNKYKHSVREPWPDRLLPNKSNIFRALKSSNYTTIGISTIFWALNKLCDYGEIDYLLRSEKQDLDYRNVPASWVINNAERIIGKIDNKPWFMYAHLADLHRPYDLTIAQAHSPFEIEILDGLEAWDFVAYTTDPHKLALFKQSKRTLYRALILYIADQINSFIQFLDYCGNLVNTTIVITADHGEEFWDHEHEEKAYYNCGYRSESDHQLGIGHGHTLYNELIHVPLIVINPPNHFKTSKNLDIVSHVDIYPTILEIAGIKHTNTGHGYSLYSSTHHNTLLSEAILYGFEKKALISSSQKVILSPYEGLLEIYERPGDNSEKMPERLVYTDKISSEELLKINILQRILHAV